MLCRRFPALYNIGSHLGLPFILYTLSICYTNIRLSSRNCKMKLSDLVCQMTMYMQCSSRSCPWWSFYGLKMAHTVLKLSNEHIILVNHSYVCAHMSGPKRRRSIKVSWAPIISKCDRRLRTVGLVAYVILPYVNRTLTSLYDENKLCISQLQPKSSTEWVIDSRKLKQ